jgi:SAM-dependent methyltransferase
VDPTIEQRVEQGWQALQRAYPPGTWFGDVYLEQNALRVRLLIRELLQVCPAAAATRVLDIGCFNGFMGRALAALGYPVDGTDGATDAEVPERAAAFAGASGKFFVAHFNSPDPFPGQPAGTYRAVILGEVLEHILNHPVGFLSAIGRLLEPQGYLLLTTPNPSTLVNAWRVLRGQAVAWGEERFIAHPKVSAAGQIIQDPDIHYLEYRLPTLRTALERAGFAVLRQRYLTAGADRGQPAWKRGLRHSAAWEWLGSHRLFGLGHYVLARKSQ